MTKAKKPAGRLFLIIGPSRVGKDSILKALLRKRSLKLTKVVTCTTRPKRVGETHGKTYNYLSEEEFTKRLKAKQFLEWAPVRDYRFGTPAEPLMKWLKAGRRVVQQIDVRGAEQLQKKLAPYLVTIFVLPGSVAELKKRLASDAFTPAQRKVRWREMEQELARQTEFDYRIINKHGELQRAINEVTMIIEAIR